MNDFSGIKDVELSKLDLLKESSREGELVISWSLKDRTNIDAENDYALIWASCKIFKI